MGTDPARLQRIVGRTIALNYFGDRNGRVVELVPVDRMRVAMGSPHGTKRLPLAAIRGVYYQRKLYTLTEFLNLTGGATDESQPGQPAR